MFAIYFPVESIAFSALPLRQIETNNLKRAINQFD